MEEDEKQTHFHDGDASLRRARRYQSGPLQASRPLCLESTMMEETRRPYGALDRFRSQSMESLLSDASSTGSRLALCQRLNQLMTCVDDLDPRDQLHHKVSRTLDNAFLLCGKKVIKPKRDALRLHMVTWNVASADPPDDISSLLHLNSPKKPDIYVIGLQEVYSGPIRFISDMAFDDTWSLLFMSTLASRGYFKVSSIRMQGLLLLFFCKLEHVPFVRDIQAKYTRTGLFGYWGNKGGVSIRLSIYGHMMCFLNCHLAAHMHYASERVDEFEHILDTHTYESVKAPSILDHRLVFWFGDLNFRIQDHGMHFVRSCLNNHTYNLLWSKDQLTMMKQKEPVIQQFSEGPLDFQPTYKFDLNSDTYDSRPFRTWFAFNGKKRKPAWTDRVLWRLRPKACPGDEAGETGKDAGKEQAVAQRKAGQQEEDEAFPLKIKQETYTSIMEYGISDHKPVLSIFTIQLRKMFASPLVRLQAEGDWSADIDAMVVYTALQPFPSSAWDWIGLYPVGFSSVSDYITYTWVKDQEVSFNEQQIQVYVSKEEIPVRGGECVLCYYSATMQCIIGISEPFTVHESKVAVEEGQFPENINGLDKTTGS